MYEMPRDPVKRAAYMKQYRIDNAEKKAAYNKQYRIDNAEKMAAYNMKQYRIDNAEKINEQIKQWKLANPEKHKKKQTLGSWKSVGMLGDLSFIYDCAYITATHCWVCKKEFKSTLDRCCDHDHATGEFRQVLCRGCNNYDSWKKK